MIAWVKQSFIGNFQAFLSLARFLVTFFSFVSLGITSYHVLLGCPQGNYH